MDFALTDDQSDVAAAARRYLTDRYPVDRIAELADADGCAGGRPDAVGWDWTELVRQGWLDPDLEPVALALLAEEGGRALHPAPWWSTVALALPAYRAGRRALPGPATLAGEGIRRGTDCRARRAGDRWLLDGRLAGVIDAHTAVELVVPAATADHGGEVALFTVAVPGVGVAVTARPGIDALRTQADVELTAAVAHPLVGPHDTGPLLETIGLRAQALLAAEAVGVADRALWLAVEHARTRVQFGQPIGSYQAVAHQLAEGYGEVELARSLAYRAAAALGDTASPADAVAEAVACAAHAGASAAVAVCETAIQVAGGMGVTWEFPLHRWYRRALWLQALRARWPSPLETIAAGLFDPSRVAP